MTTEVLSIVLRADGTGLTGTLRTAAGDVQRFGATLDATSGKTTAAGAASRRASRDVDALGDSAKRSSGGLREWASGLNTVRGTLATLGISLVAREMLGAGLAMDRLERSTTAALGSQSLAARELGFVREQAQRLGIYFPTLAEGYAGLAAATRGTNLQGAQTREIFLGVAEAGRAMNLSQEKMQGVMNAVQQIAGKGTVSMEELRQQLGDRLPGAMQVAARAMNMTVAELVKLVSEGKIASDDFLPKFAAEMRRSAEAGLLLAQNSPAATFDRLRTSVFFAGEAMARNGGILATLATGAGALTSVLNGLVSSGALAFITKGFLALAAAAAVFYAGSLLQRGFVYLATNIALSRAPLAVFNAGMVAGSAAAQVLTVRMAAASIGARGLAAALAFVQANPIGLLITGVALFVGWLYTSQQAAKAAAEELTSGIKSAKQALDDFNKTPTLASAFMLEDAKVGQSIDKIRAKLVDLREAQEQLERASTGAFAKSAAEGLAKVRDESTSLTRQLNDLVLGGQKSAAAIADMTQHAAGLTAVTPQVRSELMAVTSAVALGNLAMDNAVPKLREIIEKHYGAAAAARMTSQEIQNFGSAMEGVGKDMDGYAKRLNGILVQMAGIKGGATAATRMQVGQDINARAREFGKGDRDRGLEIMRQTGELAKYGEVLRTLPAAEIALKEATDAQANARKSNTAAIREQAKSARELEREQGQWLAGIEKTRAELEGPLAVAEYERGARLKDIAAALKAGAISETLATEARAQATEEYRRNTAEAAKNAAALAARKNIMGNLIAELEEEIQLSALTADQRRIEETLIRARNDAIKEGVTFNEEDARRTIAAADARIAANEQMVQAAEDYRNAWVGAASDAAQAFGDWFANGFRGAKDFAGKLKDIFKRMLSDLVTMMLQNNLVRPFQQWLQQAMGTGTSGGSTGALTQGGGLMSGFGNIMSSGFDKLLSGIGSLFGMGGQAATGMQTAVQAGMTLAQQNGVAVAGSSAGAGAGATTAAAGAFAKMIPIIGWIYAGMQLNGGLYDGGWKIGAHGNFMDAMKGSAATGSIGLTATTFAAGTLDDLLQRLGVSGKWASMLSGSSVLAKLFGRSDPKIQASGITGSYGFNGFSGQAYADVKQKGGLFRSDKNWTEYAALDSQIDQAFDAAAQAVNKAATSLAEQAGMDISQQLASVRINIGKLQLSNDAEEAKAQLEAALNAMIETLSAKAIEAMGFAALLDDGYKATEIMTALSAAIQLVTGNVGELERSLTALEVQKVQQAVEYFERMAETAGTTLAAAIEEITGLLANYGNLIGGVRQQIATHGLNDYQKAQLEVELGYRDMVTQANALAKALGLSGARSEDLATLEQWRAMQMADLAEQYAAQQAAAQQTWLQDLSMSDLSPLRDDQKLASVMELLNTAVANNDMSRAQDLAEQALRLGRDLYASGEDYNALYAQVTGLVGDIAPQSMEDLQGLTNEELANLADLVAGLPSQIAQELFNLLIAPPAGTEIPTTPTQPLPAPPTPNPPSGGGGGGGGSGGYDEPSCVAFDMFLDDDMRAIDAQVGDRYDTLDPQDGYSRRPVLVRGATVLQPCVRIVTESGAALVCSRSTPFTDPDAPADLPEYSTLAPDMLDKRVFVQHRGRVRVERVTRVLDAGDREVVPLDFGGRSFPAGERRGVLIYSHNMMKSESYSSMGIMSPEMASSFGTLNDSILQVVEAVNTTNARMEAAQLEALSNGTRGGLGGKSAPQY